MRCQDCNTNLTDEESVRKDERTNEYMDLCTRCLTNFWNDTVDSDLTNEFDDVCFDHPDEEDTDGA